MKVKLTFTNYPFPNVLPPQRVRAPKGTTAFQFLQRAAQLNPCYIFKYIKYSIGRYITTICGVKENKKNNFYWFIYLNGNLSPAGADLLKPKNGDTLKFEYRLWRKHVIDNHATSIKSSNNYTSSIVPDANFTTQTISGNHSTTAAIPGDFDTIPNKAGGPSIDSGKGQKMSASSSTFVILMAIGILAWKHF